MNVCIDFLNSLRNIHLQQDGAPAHHATDKQAFRNEKFPNRWISKFDPVPWPARNPDLTSCGNALWEIIKQHVLREYPSDIDTLKQTVLDAFQNFDMNVLPEIHSRTYGRIYLWVTLRGLQVDPYDK